MLATKKRRDLSNYDAAGVLTMYRAVVDGLPCHMFTYRGSTMTRMLDISFDDVRRLSKNGRRDTHADECNPQGKGRSLGHGTGDTLEGPRFL